MSDFDGFGLPPSSVDWSKTQIIESPALIFAPEPLFTAWQLSSEGGLVSVPDSKIGPDDDGVNVLVGELRFAAALIVNVVRPGVIESPRLPTPRVTTS